MDRRFIGIAHAAFVLAVLALLNAGCTLPVCTTPEIVVTRTDDVARGVCTSRNCSLRQAIQASNSCSGEQVVRIPGGTYSLALTGAGEDSNASGDLDILDRVRIVGDGMPVIDGNASDRVLDIRSGVVVNMAGLVVQNGSISLRGGIDGDGGGIQNLGNLVATNMLIRSYSSYFSQRHHF
jgi:CSLREA domain-containing protein